MCVNSESCICKSYFSVYHETLQKRVIMLESQCQKLKLDFECDTPLKFVTSQVVKKDG